MFNCHHSVSGVDIFLKLLVDCAIHDMARFIEKDTQVIMCRLVGTNEVIGHFAHSCSAD